MIRLPIAFVILAAAALSASADEDWLQYKFDAGHSGNAPDRSIQILKRLVGDTSREATSRPSNPAPS